VPAVGDKPVVFSSPQRRHRHRQAGGEDEETKLTFKRMEEAWRTLAHDIAWETDELRWRRPLQQEESSMMLKDIRIAENPNPQGRSGRHRLG
jgi:hypothetical protein